MTKLEEVARALCFEDYKPRWELLGGDGPKFIGAQWPAYRSRARAAVEALLEPDIRMVVFGSVALDLVLSDAEIKTCWRAMLSAILSEENGE